MSPFSRFPPAIWPGDFTPTVHLSDAGGTYSGAAFAATVSLTAADGTTAASLEGVAPTLTYIDASGNVLPGAPMEVGAYSVSAWFSGSMDYVGVGASTSFTIVAATPAISFGDTTDSADGVSYLATALIAGVVPG